MSAPVKNGNLDIQCPKCHGEGKIPMGDELHAALAAVKSKKRITAPELYHIIKTPWISPTAANNRLNDLVALGFLERHREGKTWVYTEKKG